MDFEDFKSIVRREKTIKGSNTLDVFAISSDGNIQITQLPVLRHLLTDLKGHSAWGITNRLKRYRGRMVQMIHEDACVPQLTKHEPIYQNHTLQHTMEERYQNAYNEINKKNKRNMNIETFKFAILASIAGMLIIALVGRV